jgi:F-box interacting protein
MRVVQFPGSHDEIMAFVYSLRSHSWKRVEDQWPKESRVYSSSVSLNGAFNWLLTRGGPSFTSSALLTFDLATEKFRDYCALPVQWDADSVVCLVVLRGSICICTNVFDTPNDVWVMNEYGVESSWTLLYTIAQGTVPWAFEFCKPLVYSKNGKKVLMELDFTDLFWYDIKERRGWRVQFHDMPDSFETAICAGSLVLLDGDSV